MINNLDYNNDEVMKILNNPDYSDDQKKNFFEKYKTDLQAARKAEIKKRVNELAKRIPIITEDIYVNFLKKYEDDNLTSPFNVIEKEIKEFEVEMAEKYNSYLESKKTDAQKAPEPEVPSEPKQEKEPELEKTDTVITNPITQDNEIAETQSNLESVNSVLNEEPEILKKPLADDFGTAKDVMPSSVDNLGEKGNASAIIISIIAIIIGAVVMYTIIKLN